MSDGNQRLRDPFESAIAERFARAGETARMAKERGDQGAFDRACAIQGELSAILNEVTQRVHGLGRWKPSASCDTVPPRKHAGAWETENPELSARIWWRLLGNFYHHQLAIGQAWEVAESPIEKALIAAIMTDPNYHQEGPPVLIPPGASWQPPKFKPETSYLVIAPQYRVDGYRVDMVVYFAQTHKRVAIECDGHEFHDRTKEQAQRDKSRDRALLGAGWPVLRFTGSEIHKDAFACADQVSNILTGLEPAYSSDAHARAAE